MIAGDGVAAKMGNGQELMTVSTPDRHNQDETAWFKNKEHAQGF